MSKRVITLDFTKVNDLYSSYMPFVLNGGLFIPTTEPFRLDEEVGLNIGLPDDPNRYELDGVVMWLTPLGAQGGKPAGIGIQMDEDTGNQLRSKIETILAGKLQSSDSTNTM